MGVRADHGVRQGDPHAVLVEAVRDHGREELEVDLVDDARAGRHDPEVPEGGLGPAQELVALAVAVVLAGALNANAPGVPNWSTWTE